jgi:succinylglutamate desuccinylase
MRYRHAITAADLFRMKPGFRNFQPVTRGQVVAEDARGEVRMPGSGRILMPLYQEQGEEGFFLVREFHPFWLRVSWALRRVQADRLAVRLPGVRRHPTSSDAVLVDKRVARWYAVQIFHLLGFRMHEDAGTHLLLRRRRFDEASLVETGPRPQALV